MITAQLIDLGRNKINKTVEVKNTKALHKEIGSHILAREWGMEETEDADVWEITSGWSTVGTVKIIKVDK